MNHKNTISHQSALFAWFISRKATLALPLALAIFTGLWPYSSTLAQDTTKTLALQRKSASESTPEYKRRWGKLTFRDRELIGKPQVALALSGGGARGLAHIGVLRAFEEANIEIVAIAGTSMGGIVGGLYAAGITTDKIEALADNVSFRSLFSNSPRRQSLYLTQRENIDKALLSLRFDNGKPLIPTGLSSAQHLTEILSLLTLRQNYAAGADFTKLSIPFTTVATDISTGEAVVLNHGNLADAIRATMAFPLAISAVEIDGRLLMDGGMLEPVPVELAQALIVDGADVKVVAVNATKPLLPKGAIKDPFDMATQVTTIMSMRELNEELAQADYVITPRSGNSNGTDFSHISDFIDPGYHNAQLTTKELLQDHNQKLIAKNLVVHSFTITGAESNCAELIDSLEALRGNLVSQERLDNIFQTRWNQNDLVQLEIESTTLLPSDSLKTDPLEKKNIHLQISLTPQPDMAEIRVQVEDNLAKRQDAAEDFLLRRITSLGTIQLDSIANWTVDHHRNSGADLCAVRVCLYIPETNTIYLRIDEAKGNNLTIKGTSRTRPSFVLDRIGGFATGVPFTIESARRAYRDIYGSGLFERVSIAVIPTENGADVDVVVHEKKTLQLQLGYHWDDEYHSEGYLNALESNILGIGLEGSAMARFADRRQRFSLGLRTDRIFRTHVAFNLKGYSEKVDRRVLAPDGMEIGFR
ncbi:patatin-like phospholipase family protein, partial [bacterium AH-315-J21]|nr:patatin-like phospholipase family protein [bacterium AH-315-J21]